MALTGDQGLPPAFLGSAPPLPEHPPDFEILTLTSARAGDAHTLCLFGELDIAGTGRVEDELMRIEATDAPSIVLDLSGLAYLDLSGVRLVLDAEARSRTTPGRLKLLRGPLEVHRVFELCGVAGMLPFAE